MIQDCQEYGEALASKKRRLSKFDKELNELQSGKERQAKQEKVAQLRKEVQFLVDVMRTLEESMKCLQETADINDPPAGKDGLGWVQQGSRMTSEKVGLQSMVEVARHVHLH